MYQPPPWAFFLYITVHIGLCRIPSAIIDIRDYENGIGNSSREQYVCTEQWTLTPCYSEADGFVKFYVNFTAIFL